MLKIDFQFTARPKRSEWGALIFLLPHMFTNRRFLSFSMRKIKKYATERRACERFGALLHGRLSYGKYYTLIVLSKRIKGSESKKK